MSRLHSILLMFAFAPLPFGGAANGDSLRPGDTKRIDRLIQDLGSEQYRVREAATPDLAAMGEPARKALRKAIHSRDPEIRGRAAHLIEALVDQDRSRDMTALQGFWVLKKVEYLGWETNQDPMDWDEIEERQRELRQPAETRGLEEDRSQYRTTLEITGADFEHRWWGYRMGGQTGGVFSNKGNYALDVDRSPKVMDKWWPESGDLKSSSWCFYEVSGDTLRLCTRFTNNAPNNLPARFATDRDQDVVLLTFKRPKK